MRFPDPVVEGINRWAPGWFIRGNGGNRMDRTVGVDDFFVGVGYVVT